MRIAVPCREHELVKRVVSGAQKADTAVAKSIQEGVDLVRGGVAPGMRSPRQRPSDRSEREQRKQMRELADLLRRQAADRAIDVDDRVANGRIMYGVRWRKRVRQHHRNDRRHDRLSIGVEKAKRDG